MGNAACCSSTTGGDGTTDGLEQRNTKELPGNVVSQDQRQGDKQLSVFSSQTAMMSTMGETTSAQISVKSAKEDNAGMEFETESKESVGRTISSASKFQKKQLAILIPMDDKDVERNPDFQTPFNGE